MTKAALSTATRARLDELLDRQALCDLVLSPIADPRGKSVLVVGSGAAVLWCLRRGAAEVVGLDRRLQDSEAMQLAAERFDVAGTERWELRDLAIEQAGSLGRTFDLVVAGDAPERAAEAAPWLAACARHAAPGSGRIAVAISPLFYSSTGPGGAQAPWNHLTEPAGTARAGLSEPSEPAETSENSAEPPSGTAPVAARSEIPLDRLRLADFLAAVSAAGCALLHLVVIPDRHLGALPGKLLDLGGKLPGGIGSSPGLSVADLSIEGIAAELARIEPGIGGLPIASVASAVERDERRRSGRLSRLALLGEGDQRLSTAPPQLVDPDGEALGLRFDFAPEEGVRALRWEPLENRRARIWLTEVSWDDSEGRSHPLEPAALRTNGAIGPDGSIRFSTLFPWIAFDLSPGARPVGFRLAGAWKVAALDATLSDLEMRLDARLGRISRLYLDSGRGFPEREDFAERVDPGSPRFAIRFAFPSPIAVRRLRWHPTEGQFSVVRIDTVFAERASGARVPLNPATAESNGRRLDDGAIAFDTFEPWLAFAAGGEIAAFEVRGTWQLVDAGRRVEEIRAELEALRTAPGTRLGRALAAPFRWFRRPR